MSKNEQEYSRKSRRAEMMKAGMRLTVVAVSL
jgi:hypothetical protein